MSKRPITFSLGVIGNRGDIHMKHFYNSENDYTSHQQEFGSLANVNGSQRWRMENNQVKWYDVPSRENYFRVDDAYAKDGVRIKGHYVWSLKLDPTALEERVMRSQKSIMREAVQRTLNEAVGPYQLGAWYVGSSSSRYDSPVIFVPVARQENGAFTAVFGEFENRRAILFTTRNLKLMSVRVTDPKDIVINYGTEGQRMIDRVQAKLVTYHQQHPQQESVKRFRDFVAEDAPDSQEAWIKANKQKFKDEYGDEEGERILYATANKRAKG